uniref:non-specific serine/threonine protein kinase n=2 Tax=Lygus hesperus TaxID=30085 RepID=A0A146L1J0_LYGHE
MRRSGKKLPTRQFVKIAHRWKLLSTVLTFLTGGYGTIYKATSSRGVQVVLKEVILANQEEEEVQVTRKEAQLLSSLSHPHIIRYVDHWETPDLLTIAMEYAEGGSLEKVISKRESHFEETEALKIFVEVVAAVEYLHRKEIIHRDICARNVLVCSTGVIKLCDFGVSKRMRSVRTGSLKGDPSHFAPELCYGGKCSEETDMWALGCLLHHLLSLRPLFKSPTIAALLVTILADPVPPLPPSYSAALESLIFSLLSHEPWQRPRARVLLSHPLLSLHLQSLHLAHSSLQPSSI